MLSRGSRRAAARAAPWTGSRSKLYPGRCSRVQPVNHASCRCAARSWVPTPRSVSIDRDRPVSDSETTTPVRPGSTGPASSTLRPASSPATMRPAGSAAWAATSRARPPSATIHAATLAACPPAPAEVVAGVSVPGWTGPARDTITSRWASPSTQITPRLPTGQLPPYCIDYRRSGTSPGDAGPQPGAEQVEADHQDRHHQDVGHHDVEPELLSAGMNAGARFVVGGTTG